MTIRRICLPLLVAMALAGCANGGTGDSAGAPAGLPASEAPTSAPPAPGGPSSADPTEESGPVKPPAGIQTLTGTIIAGVEPNCLLLDDHLLIISDAKLQSAAKAGATVTVTGRAEEGMMTTCQQGTPFVVATLRAN